MRWVESLRGRDFVATQSRLTSIFAGLKQLVQQSQTVPEVRLAELQRQRHGIDAEMERDPRRPHQGYDPQTRR